MRYLNVLWLAGVLICGAGDPLTPQLSMNIGAGTTWYVDDDDCPAPGAGTEGDPFCLIQDCINAAMDGEECVVAPGTYFENINLFGKAITLRSSDGPEATTIDADGSGTVITCDSSEGPNTVIDGFTITGGTGTTFDGILAGGGMRNINSSPTIVNCAFLRNVASGVPSGGWGGGMHNSGGNPTVTKCTFSGNDAKEGGGMFNINSSPMVSNCTFSGNFAGFGGGMHNKPLHSSPTVTNCTFSGNTAGFDGGGMNNGPNSSPEVTNCTFSGNTAGRDGGGMKNSIISNPTVTNCTFSGNTASRRGGGMSNFLNFLTVTNCTFSGNTAREGGGMNNSGSTPTVTNCTFSGNSADSQGGGMYNAISDPTVTHCTFSGNTAREGGGMFNILSSSPIVTNCTFSGNDADYGRALAFNFFPQQQQSPSDLSMTNCILWDGGDEVWNNDNSMINIAYSDVQGGWPGEGNIDLDPLLVESGFRDDNGTPGIPDDDFWVEGDFHLLPGSPCIDAGDNTAVPEGIVTDLDGNPRFVDDPNTDDTGFGDPPLVDMGAYEVQDPCADDDGDGRVMICHIPPGNPDNAHPITVSVSAVPAHLAHGDYCGPCEAERSTETGRKAPPEEERTRTIGPLDVVSPFDGDQQ